MFFWKQKKVVVTGGRGFIGSHLVERLLAEGAEVRVADLAGRDGSKNNLAHVSDHLEFFNVDLADPQSCNKICRGADVVMHLAARIRGVGYNVQHHGEMFFANALINLHMLEAARLAHVDRFLCVSTVGVYPKECKVPTPEEDGFKGEPESSGFGYGWSKRQAEVQARCYREEYGMKIAIVRPYNVYGPRMDFNLETAPVVSSQIRKVLDAKDVLTVWGDGEQTRSFTYVSDEVAGMLLAVEKYPEADPLNIGTSEEIKIKDLVRLIVRLSGKDLQIQFDTSKPSGAARRCPDISKAARLIGYQPKVWMEEGARRTMDWYQESILASQ
ncbi:MAG: SDR family NAD(P)-dependent oxidoreductase [Chthoniobacterales bacterium]|nr:SDR family NAD(P)-dependent oxidoreductase [Chthoniobacterales bacterium]